MTTGNKCGRCEGLGYYSCYDSDATAEPEGIDPACHRCKGTGLDPLWAENHKLREAVAAIHSTATDKHVYWARVECERICPELKETT